MAPPLLLRLKSLEDEDPWIIEQKTFNIMADYLQPDSATSTAMTAAALDTLTPMKRHLLEAERTESPESFMLETWGTFIEIAKQIPSDHPSQMRLVHLVKELTILPLTRVPIWGVRDLIYSSPYARMLTSLLSSCCAVSGPHLDRPPAARRGL